MLEAALFRSLHFSFFPFLVLLLLSRVHSNLQRPSTHGTTAALQAFPIVIGTSSASASVCLSVRVCYPRTLPYCSREQEHGQSELEREWCNFSVLDIIVFIPGFPWKIPMGICGNPRYTMGLIGARDAPDWNPWDVPR